MSLNEITYMNWREIIKPEKVQIASQTPTYGKFVWEPLERGFGITIGNSLRRIILSSASAMRGWVRKQIMTN